MDPDPVLLGSLPFIFRQKYTLHEGVIREYRILLLYPTSVAGTPREIRQDQETLERLTEKRVVFVFDALQSFNRQRLIAQGVQFIVPGTQLFLPDFFIDLRERASSTPPPPDFITQYSYATQALLFYHLLIEPLEDMELTEIAARLQYAPMTITRAQRELCLSETATVKRTLRGKLLVFELKGLSLWQHTQQYVRNPIIRVRHEISAARLPPDVFRRAGLSALAERTMIGEPEVPVIAIGKKNSLQYLTQPNREPENMGTMSDIEIWAYDPVLLSPAGQAVDPLSLYCSLSDTEDERGQSAREELLRSLSW